MYTTGFADEAGVDLDTQIRVTRELGWRHIEARKVQVDGFPADWIHDIPEPAFERLADALAEAGIRVNCFGSAIGNWSKRVSDPFEQTVAEIERAVPRMQRLGARLVRIMSYAVCEGEDQAEPERFRRLREIQRRFADAGLTPVHENCMNYGGRGWPFTLKLVEAVPGLRLCFDTGNPLDSDDYSSPPPRPKQSSWEFYRQVRDHVEYIHIKDGRRDPATGAMTYTFPGEGAGDVRRILGDLLERGYDGGISIEPHMGAVVHDPTSAHSRDAADLYVAYGRRLMAMLDALQAERRQRTPPS